jgi:hypothetical protein
MRFILLIILGILLYKFFEALVDKKKTPVEGNSRAEKSSFQTKYKDLIEDADFEELDKDDKK